MQLPWAFTAWQGLLPMVVRYAEFYMTAHQRGFGIEGSNRGMANGASGELAEVLCAFSYALDLTGGQAAGHSIRACWIASQMALRLELPAQLRRTIFYATLLKDLGCSSTAARIAQLYRADDRQFQHDQRLVGASAAQHLRFVVSHTGEGDPLTRRAATLAQILRHGEEIEHDLVQTRCEQGADIARLLRFPGEVATAIFALDEHWDGTGRPLGMAADTIPLASRMALLAQVADVFHSHGGPDVAREEVARQYGRWLDPMLCRLFDELCREKHFWDKLIAPDLSDRLLALEPAQGRAKIDEPYLDDIAAAFALVIDAKSPFTQGHSLRVGQFADLVAEELGMPEQRRRALRRAAMLHDLGKLGLSSRILEKPGQLDASEWEAVRQHPLHTAEILSRIEALHALALIAGSHSERLDGRGYPMGIDAQVLSQETRIITLCDVFDALTTDRPHRPAVSVSDALAIMQGELGTVIDADCHAALCRIVARGDIPERCF